MSKKVVFECDRCNEEIGEKKGLVIIVEGKEIELCQECRNEFKEFMEDRGGILEDFFG